MDALRPDPRTLKCPKGSESCSNFTKPSNTICMAPEYIGKGLCPITSLDIVPYSSNSPEYSIYEDMYLSQIYEGMYLNYSK